jgi:hypothetical protein
MVNKRFNDFLEKQASHTQSKEIDWDTIRNEWIEHIDEFYRKIESYIEPYKDKIKISYNKKRILEEYLGEYEVKTATIILGANGVNILTLEPIGRIIIGAEGRIDMKGPNGKIRFLLVDSNVNEPRLSVKVYKNGKKPPKEKKIPDNISLTWKIASQPPNIRFSPLDNESFFDALMDISNE